MRNIVILLLLVLGFAVIAAMTPAEAKILAWKAEQGMERFPIGFWNYTFVGNPEHLAHQQERDVEQWQEAGFTFAMSPFFDPGKPEEVAHIRQMLGWAQERRIALLLASGGGVMEVDQEVESYRRQFRDMLRQFADLPALLGFIVFDEPNAAMTRRVVTTCRIQYEEAPHLLSFLNLYPHLPETEAAVDATRGWSAYLDDMIREGKLQIISYDYYGQLMGQEIDPEGVEGYFRNLFVYRDAAMRSGIPFWTTLGSVGHWHFRVPTPEDLRWQFHTAICAGSGGVMWFYYYQRHPEDNFRMGPVNEFWETTPTYATLRDIHRGFEKRYGDLFHRLVSRSVAIFPEGRGGFPAFRGEKDILEIGVAGQMKIPDAGEHSAMIGEFVDAEENTCWMVVNASMRNQTRFRLKLKGPAAAWQRFNWNGELEPLPAWELQPDDDGNVTWHVWLGPGQELVLWRAKEYSQ